MAPEDDPRLDIQEDAPSFRLLATISIAESKSNPRAHFDPVKLAGSV